MERRLGIAENLKGTKQRFQQVQGGSPTIVINGVTCYNPSKWPKINGFAWGYNS